MAEVLKNLPGFAGEAFSADRTSAKIGTATLGFMLDVLLDPAGFVGKVGTGAKVLANGTKVTQGGKVFGSTIIGATGVRKGLERAGISEVSMYAAGGSIAKGLTKAVGGSEKAQDIARRMGGNIAMGNIFGATTVVPARTMVDSVIQRGLKIANNSDYRGTILNHKNANALLDWFVGPTASADEKQRRIIMKGITLTEELPRLVNAAAEGQQSLLTRVKGKEQQYEATMLFNDLVVADPTGKDYTDILEKLSKYGID